MSHANASQHVDAYDVQIAALEASSGCQRGGGKGTKRADESAADSTSGCILPFDAYLTVASRSRQQAAHWSWRVISTAWVNGDHGERGTVALATAPDAGRAEAAPGISLTVQVVQPQCSTRSHRHSFWHLYVVLSGQGSAYIDEEAGFPLAPGDSFYVPPWARHRLDNPDLHAPLVLYGLQNLPQLAELGTVVRESPDGSLQHVYRPASGDGAI